jgi:hypothetical protein
MRRLLWTCTIAVLLGSAYLLGRITPPNELQQAHTSAAIASIERQTAIDAAVAPFDVVAGSLLRLVPLVCVALLLVWAAGLLWIDLVNTRAARRE